MNAEIKRIVAEKVQLARDLFGFPLTADQIQVRCDIRGKTAGQAIRCGQQYSLRLNPQAIKEHWDHIAYDTIPHEIAHLVCFALPHLGKNHDGGWRRVAKALGSTGARCHDLRLGKWYVYEVDGHRIDVSEKHHKGLQSGRWPYLINRTWGVQILKENFLETPFTDLKAAGKMKPSTTQHPIKKIGDTEMATFTTEAKAQIKAWAKEFKINPVGKSMDALLEAVAARKDQTPEVTLFLANGGCITELPGFEGIKPLPNRKETSAGGKQVPAKKTPRKVSKEPKESKPAKAPKDSGMVTLASILEELGVEGRIARRKLRGSEIAKPGTQWEWEAGHADIAKVRALLTK